MACKVREFRSLIYRYYDTEVELARKIGWNKQKLNKISNGERVPSIAELADLASGLNTSTGELADLFLRHMSPIGQQTSGDTPHTS